MDIRPKEREALAHIGSRWWGGPDPGVVKRRVVLDVTVPLKRTDQEVLDLFVAFLEHLDGGFGNRVEVVQT